MQKIIRKRQVNRNKGRDYVNNKQLHTAFMDWYQSGRVEPPMIIVKAIMQICERLGTKSNFRNYTYKEDMIGSAIEKCFVAVQGKKYDLERANENPFAYFTQIAYNEFIRIITDEKKQSYIKHKSLQDHMTQSMLNGETIEAPINDDSGKLETLVAKFEKPKEDKVVE